MESEYIWRNGQLMPSADATVHVLSHALHYGTSVFEGIRAYETEGGTHMLCGPEHFERMLFSCKVARLPSPHDVDTWMAGTAATLQANVHHDAYIRPLVFRGYGGMGVDARQCPIETLIATMHWGTYLGADGLEGGVDVQVSSWRRPTPALAKIGGHYAAAQRVAMEAHDNGYGEGIALDSKGAVSEGSGQNVFIVHKGELITPPLFDSVLEGITRECVMVIADDLGIPVAQRSIPRDMLYLAEEVFLTGTATEICPVRSVDGLEVGSGARGPITKTIQDVFFGIVRGERPDKWSWLTHVPIEAVGHVHRVRAS